jgi:hypothetical protein
MQVCHNGWIKIGNSSIEFGYGRIHWSEPGLSYNCDPILELLLDQTWHFSVEWLDQFIAVGVFLSRGLSALRCWCY